MEANRARKSNNGHEEEWIEEDVTFNLLGIISRQLGKNEDAVEYFMKGLELNKSSYDILVNLASIHGDMNNFELANTFFDKAEALNITDPTLQGYLLANKGWMHENQGLRLAARKYYIDAINMTQPNSHPQIITNLQNIDRYCEVNHCE